MAWKIFLPKNKPNSIVEGKTLPRNPTKQKSQVPAPPDGAEDGLCLADLAEYSQVLKPTATVRQAAELLLQEKGRVRLVAENAGRVLGVVTGPCLMAALLAGKAPETPVREVMLPPGQILRLPEREGYQEIAGDYLILTGAGERSGLCTCRNFRLLWRELKQGNREMATVRRLNRELEGILQASYDGVVVADEARILRVSEGYRRITGLEPAELVGSHWADMPDNDHMCLRTVKEVFKVALEEKQPVTRMRRNRAGNDVYFTATPILDLDGQVVRMVCNVRDVTELNYLRDQLERVRCELDELRTRQWQPEDFVVESQAMRRVVDLIRRAARVDATVLITGESGVGKELVAKLLHRLSPRKEGPLIFINCGAIPESLVESELFGYEKGAFTGANREGKVGLLELGNKGTLVLDEVGELPLGVQVKLLRVIQEGEMYRIGGVGPVAIDVRLVACTNRDLEKAVREGKFREDLYWRLNVIPVDVPPLRERREAILPLVNFYLERFAGKYGLRKQLDLDAFRALEGYEWPGNVRELQHMIERLVVLTPGDVIRREHLPEQVLRSGQGGGERREEAVFVRGVVPLAEAREELEHKLLERAMQVFGTSRRAAEALGVDHSTVVRKLQHWRDHQVAVD